MPEEPQEQITKESFFKISGLFLVEVIKIALIASIVVVLIRYFLIQPFFVKGASMEPNFSDGQYLIVDELTYRLKEPERGDVIVFKYPRDPKQFYIKRIIALPGEQLEILNNQVIVYNDENPKGQVLEEDYLEENEMTFPNKKWKLKDDEYFVMGDNRVASSDSRTWGQLDKKYIVGRVFVRAFPLDEFTVFKSEESNITN